MERTCGIRGIKFNQGASEEMEKIELGTELQLGFNESKEYPNAIYIYSNKIKLGSVPENMSTVMTESKERGIKYKCYLGRHEKFMDGGKELNGGFVRIVWNKDE